MGITARIVLDSISPKGKRLTTFSLEYPRFIHAELMTHRVFSRNASSSRAIPVKKMIERVKNDPAMPIHWGANMPGMQANEELGLTSKALCQAYWLKARDFAVEQAEAMLAVGLHKQVANRILEPWSHIAVLVSATEFGNFYNLRYHKDAQPEIRVLATEMLAAEKASAPMLLHPGEWHLPYIMSDEWSQFDLETLKKMSAARCARVSYLNHEGKNPTLEEDMKLFERLMAGFPKHASPTEHQATPSKPSIFPSKFWGNYQGWDQFRKMIPGEYLPEFARP